MAGTSMAINQPVASAASARSASLGSEVSNVKRLPIDS